jgi:predicted Zn-dependent protease
MTKKCSRAPLAFVSVAALWGGCLGHGPAPSAKAESNASAPAVSSSSEHRAAAPMMVRVDPQTGEVGGKVATLTALEDELHRAMTELGKQAMPPYFIGYEVHDRREVSIVGSEGALAGSDDHRARVLSTDVRVGDHRRDSSHTLRGYFDLDGVAGGSGMLPLDDAQVPIRAVAWAETDRRYKAALERLLKIKSDGKMKTAEDDPSDDFSKEKPVAFVEPLARLTVDVPAWEARIRRLSARFQRLPEPHQSQVTLELSSVNRLITNSEGTSIQTGRNYARLSVMASVRADDGMTLERHESFDMAGPDGLPDDAAVERTIDVIIDDLQALRRAPLAEPYVGPAILEGKAAAVFFHEIFGHRIEGHRQKRDEEGQTFAKKIGEPVMPSFISVYDDPAIARLGHIDLNGFYRFDDEGVPAQRVSLVESGVLKGFLMGRSPVRGFVQSNGHGRRQEGRVPVARQGNLVVEPSLSVSSEELRQRLRAEAQRQGKPFGLAFRDISGGFTNTGRTAPQAFKVLPVLVYRVWVDGRPDELVRGADVVGTPLASLSKILAAGDDYRTFNGFCGAESGFLPVSATSPSLLVQQIEIERKQKGNDKPPILPAPTRASGGASSEQDGIRRAMQDELDRTKAELHMDDQPRPYFASYTVNDTDWVLSGATLGALTTQLRTRWRILSTSVRVGDRSFDNSNYGPGGGRGTLALDDDYAATRRSLWLSSDEAYKRAVEGLARKKAAVATQAAGKDDVPDFSDEPKAETVSLPALPAPNQAALGALAERLSAVFLDYPGIASSQVTGFEGLGRQRHLSTEGTWADERDSIVYLDVSAATQASDGMRVRDNRSFTARSSAELEARAGALAKDVEALAGELLATSKAGIPEGGDAVVLFEERAAAQIIKHLLADRLAATPRPKVGRDYAAGTDDLTEKLGQRVTASMLSVYDDPRQELGPGKQYLIGSYHADDEGVPAQKVSLVEGGVLKTLLTGRTPIKGVRGSNGHGRGGYGVGIRGHIGNLFVSARGGLSRSGLRARLASESRTRHAEAYIVRLVDDANSAHRSGSVEPLVAYQLKDGKELPVRGFTIEGLLPKTLKDVAAAGADPFVMNFIDGYRGMGVASSIVAPALLFVNLEVRKETDHNPKLPLYPHPLTVPPKGVPATR